MSQPTEIDFHGSALLAMPGDEPNNPLIAMKPVVEGMGLDWSTQNSKLKHHPVLSKGIQHIAIPSAGGLQDTLALPLNKLNFWLATANSRKVAPEIRERIELYQHECSDVLFAHFGGTLTKQPRITLRDVGGVVKSVTHKELAEFGAQLAEANAASEKRMALAFAAAEQRMENIALGHDPSIGRRKSQMTMLEIVEANNVTMKKDRAKLTRALSAGMVSWCRANGVLTGQTSERKTILYPVECVPHWLKEVGAAKIRAHIARVTGQGVFDYEAEKKKRGK